MRVVFMGTPDFAVPALEALLARNDVVAVYARPGSSGRSRRKTPSPVALRAQQAGIPVEHPSTLRSEETLEGLRAWRPDVIVVAAYGLILPPAALALPPLGCVNIHASLLPRWRGAAPIQRAILAGDDVTGVTIMRMEEGLDTGPWCEQRTVSIDEKTTADLTAELAEVGARALMEALPRISDGSVRWVAQDDARATYADKVTSVDVSLEPSLTVDEALRRVRASNASARSRVRLAGRELTLLAADRSPARLEPGSASCVNALELGLADGAVRLDSVVPEGRGAMDAAAFVRGARLPETCTWTAR